MWEGIDRRKFPRVKLRCEILIREAEGSQFFSTTTENIGAGGVCVVLGDSLPKFSVVKLRLKLQEGAPTIECLGKVMWMIRSRSLPRKDETYDIGIEFLNISDSSKGRIRSLVTRLSSEVQESPS